MINSQQKGKDFERQIAKIFSKWWDDSEDSVRRVPLSGGYPKGKTWGDLICYNSCFFPFLISLKKVEGWVLDQLFFNYTKCKLMQWLQEIRYIFQRYLSHGDKLIMERYLLMPVLVVAKNRYKPIVLCHVYDLDRLKPFVVHNFSVNPEVLKIFDVRVMFLDYFLKKMDILKKDNLLNDGRFESLYGQIYGIDVKVIRMLKSNELGVKR